MKNSTELFSPTTTSIKNRPPSEKYSSPLRRAEQILSSRITEQDSLYKERKRKLYCPPYYHHIYSASFPSMPTSDYRLVKSPPLYYKLISRPLHPLTVIPRNRVVVAPTRLTQCYREEYSFDKHCELCAKKEKRQWILSRVSQLIVITY